MVTGLREGKFEFKSIKLRSKIIFFSHPINAEELSKYLSVMVDNTYQTLMVNNTYQTLVVNNNYQTLVLIYTYQVPVNIQFLLPSNLTIFQFVNSSTLKIFTQVYLPVFILN